MGDRLPRECNRGMNNRIKRMPHSQSHASSEHSGSLLPSQTTFETGSQTMLNIAEPSPRHRSALEIECHGISNLLRTTSRKTRIGWAIFLTLIVIGFLYEIGKTIYNYYTNPILTTVSVKLLQTMQFPEVEVCPLNFINYTFATKNNMNLVRASKLQKSFAKISSDDSLLKKTMTTWQSLYPSISEGQSGLRQITKDHKMTDQEFFLAIGYQTSGFFKECLFENRNFNCSQWITPTFDRDYGKCFLVQIPEMIQQRNPGIGLTLLLDINTNLYPPETEKSLSPPMYDGIVFSVHHKYDPCNLIRFRVSPGRHTHFDMEQTHMQLINVDRYTKHIQHCIEPEEGAKNLKILRTHYTVEACKMDCVQSVVYDNCECLIHMDERYVQMDKITQRAGKGRQRTFCSRAVLDTCVDRDVLNNTEALSKIRECTSRCFAACEYWKYHLSGTSTLFPSSSIIDAHRNRLNHTDPSQVPEEANPEKWRKDYVILSLAFSEMQVRQVIQDKSMTLDTFISNLGGQMGIWLGASLVTLVQFIFFVVGLFVGKRERTTEDGQESDLSALRRRLISLPSQITLSPLRLRPVLQKQASVSSAENEV